MKVGSTVLRKDAEYVPKQGWSSVGQGCPPFVLKQGKVGTVGVH